MSTAVADLAVPFLDLVAQHEALRDELRRAYDDTLARTAFVGGSAVERFEAEFASYCGTSDAIGVGSGTDALRLALAALGVGHGDEVVTVAHTFAATAEAVVQLGARVRFADVLDGCGTMDPEALPRALTRRTKAVVAVHLYGQPAEMAEIVTIAHAAGVPVVEDACQAHGARYRGDRAGSLADAACFSFYPSKNLGACGDGGAVTTDDPAVAARVRLLRDHGQPRKYVHTVSGWNSRLDALQGAILSVKLPYLDGWNAARRAHVRRYTELLSDVAWLRLTEQRAQTEGVHHLAVIRAPDRDGLRAHCEAAGVGVGLHYPVPLHRQPAFADAVALPVTEAWAEQLLSLPMYPEMTEAQLARVADVVADYTPRLR